MSGRLALAQVLCPPYLPIKHAIETNEKMITTTYLEKDEKSQEDILKKHSPVSIEKYLKKGHPHCTGSKEFNFTIIFI